MIEYKEVSIVRTYWAGPYPPAYGLCIDNNDFLYEINEKETRLYDIWDAASYIYDKKFRLPGVKIPMNKDNPKETLDRFFKLLLLA